jgi:hypothetical protein
MTAKTEDRASESVRTLSTGGLCAGCGGAFVLARPDQRHCRPSCRRLAARNAEAERRRKLLERLDPGDPGRAE